MTLKWIDRFVDGLVDHYCSDNVYELCENLKISLSRLDPSSSILLGNSAMYIRNYFDEESIFIRDDLPSMYEQYVVAHELAHALLHIDLYSAAFSKDLINRGKIEKQADYFAIKLLEIDLDASIYEGFTIEQIAAAENMPIRVAELACDYL